MEQENLSLATELLHEIKATSRRWFLAFCVMVVLEIATIVGFLWYISLPVSEYKEVTQDAAQTDVEGSELFQTIGGE